MNNRCHLDPQNINSDYHEGVTCILIEKLTLLWVSLIKSSGLELTRIHVSLGLSHFGLVGPEICVQMTREGSQCRSIWTLDTIGHYWYNYVKDPDPFGLGAFTA